MKIKCEKDILLKSLMAVNNIVNERQTIPVLANILIETKDKNTVLSATDLKISVEYKFMSEIVESGSITVPAKKFTSIIRELPAGIVSIISDSNNNVSITCGKSSYKIIGIPKDEFPTIPVIDSKSRITLEQKTLKEVIKKTNFSMSHDTSRHILNGVMCSAGNNGLLFVATDCRRLSIVTKKIENSVAIEKKVIIPAKMVFELQRTLSDSGTLDLIIGEKEICFEIDDARYVAQLIEGNFPDYKQVMPKSEPVCNIELNTEELYGIVRRSAVLMDKNISRLKIQLNDNKMIFTAKVPDLGEFKEDIDVKYDGEEIIVGFNPAFLLDVLKSVEDDSIFLKIACHSAGNMDRKVGIFTTGEDFLYIVMPMEVV